MPVGEGRGQSVGPAASDCRRCLTGSLLVALPPIPRGTAPLRHYPYCQWMYNKLAPAVTACRESLCVCWVNPVLDVFNFSGCHPVIIIFAMTSPGVMSSNFEKPSLHLKKV